VSGAPFVELHVPADPAFAITVRAFVRASAASLGLSEVDVEILCLAATELLANAVEHAQPALDLTLAVQGERWRLQANGAGPLERVDGEVVDRAALLRGIADVAIASGGQIELSAAASE
jgi:hypothetical protein